MSCSACIRVPAYCSLPVASGSLVSRGTVGRPLPGGSFFYAARSPNLASGIVSSSATLWDRVQAFEPDVLPAPGAAAVDRHLWLLLRRRRPSPLHTLAVTRTPIAQGLVPVNERSVSLDAHKGLCYGGGRKDAHEGLCYGGRP